MILLLSLVWMHFISDFLLQTDKMATSKSGSNKWLAIHVLVYTIPFLLFGPVYALVNGLLHFIVDFCSSRATSWLWKRNERHWFFVVIGLDQALHMTCLLLTIPLMGW